ncbi:hypothetical protein PPL_07499 [Heterostelium album PN500]|uniref:Uncharacterized protein n=1 Tax=Heterostelium pallidum (strain ATCC 26659 / Pp 5 / PN500) TaxID=670386 RepID=D3BG48_HETP5|nr:hypothetical protein PPL_07499 [Heterostelium album PN500]EFA79640.1 hypothetical protein PPL_07499 [Heterostelium album PN500]|eukprot:XP_020431761.1 hypothetical protein PPL_07499 [Heterostelium album PN500]
MIGVDQCSNGTNKTVTKIYKYNINDSTFERYSTIKINTSYHQFPFIFKGNVYTLTPYIKKILKFDINNKTTVELPIEIPQHPSTRAACTDGNGNIYILSDTLGLQRISIDDNQIVVETIIDFTVIKYFHYIGFNRMMVKLTFIQSKEKIEISCSHLKIINGNLFSKMTNSIES